MTMSLSVISSPYHNAVRKMPTFCMLCDVGWELHLQITGYLQSIELLQSTKKF